MAGDAPADERYSVSLSEDAGDVSNTDVSGDDPEIAPSKSASQNPVCSETGSLWHGAVAVGAATGIAFALYWLTAAPDLTWAHHGADGGDLLAAAASRGVPHPTGYPLYTVLLRLWLDMGKMLAPDVSAARVGNLLSAGIGAASVGLTVLTAGRLVQAKRTLWWLAAAGGLLWAVSPLLWSQSLITEVYTLHTLLAALLAAVVLFWPHRPFLVAVIVALGLAHHLTFALLLPAAAYMLWRQAPEGHSRRRWTTTIAAVAVLLLLLYARIPIAALGSSPPPVNWGYADNWRGFWWLVSGTAYREYVGNLSMSDIALRTTAWARTLVNQYTPVGLIVVALGLAAWDRNQPQLRTLALLWLVPISLYTVIYATRDAEVYLLPVVWLFALLLVVGATESSAWIGRRTAFKPANITSAMSLVLVISALALAGVRAPTLNLRADNEAPTWLRAVGDEVEPNSIVISSSDRKTFALWYGAWGSGSLLQQVPDIIIVNDSLYQFAWYRRLLVELYPSVPGIGDSLEELLRLNSGERPIYLAEPIDAVPITQQESVGVLWRYVP